MTARKRWPDHAEGARIGSISAARTGLAVMREVVTTEKSPDTLRRAAIAQDAFYRIIENLITVGPRSDGRM